MHRTVCDYGNVGKDTLIRPGLATWDFSVFKDTRIRERLNLQFWREILLGTSREQIGNKLPKNKGEIGRATRT